MKTVIVKYYGGNNNVDQTEIEAEIIKSNADTIQLYADSKTVAVFPLGSVIGVYFKPE